MKLQRRGRYRNHGATVLISEDLTKSSKSRRNSPVWNLNLAEVHFSSNGTDRGGSYRYQFTFDAADLFSLLEVALPELDVSLRATSAGAIASLEEILTPKE